ncbi:MAG: TIGR03545 family protein, partial [bacterium]
LRLSVTLKHLQVTDKAAPMTNALEVGRMTFALAPKPLAWKKIVVEQGEITGIRTGTPRTASGALPAAAAGAGSGTAAGPEGPGMGAQAKDAAGNAMGSAMANLKQQFDPKQITAESLASYRKVREEQDRLTKLAAEWEQRADAIKTDGKSVEIKAWVDKVRKTDFSGVEGVKRGKDALDEGKRYQDEVKTLTKTVADAKSTLSSEISGAKGTLKEINALKEQDINGALGQIKGGAFSAEGLARAVIGNEWFDKLQTYLGWFHKLRALMPPKAKADADAKPAPPPARKGKDIAFPFHYAWPGFHLKEAKLDGATAGGLAYAGSLTDVSTQPSLVERPTVVKVSGAHGAQALDFRLDLDYRKETPREHVAFSYKGLELAGTKLGSAGGPVAVKHGVGAVSADLAVKGETIGGNISFIAAPVALDHQLDAAQAKQKLMQIVHEVLSKLNKFEAKVNVSGTLAGPDFGLKTNLDKQFGDAVKRVMQKEIDAMKAKVRARVNELVDGEKGKLEGMVNAKSAGALDKFKGKDASLKSVQAELDKALEEIKQKGAAAVVPTGGGLPKLPGGKKKLF